MNGAQLLAGALKSAGVGTLFNLSGNQVMPLYSPLVDAGVDLVHTRHEAGAVHMADAYARLAERPCPVLLTAGPGHANALGAVYVAKMAESPVVVLSGSSELSSAGKGAFQEIDQVAMARRVAKAAWLCRETSRLGDELARAYRLANSGRPGPVCLSLPADVLKDATRAEPPAPAAFRPRTAGAGDGDARALLDALGRARTPLLLAGPAMARGSGWELVRRLGEAAGVPALPMDSSRGANDPALGGIRTIFPKADLVVLVDRRADFSLGFGKPPLFSPEARFVDATRAVVARARELASPARAGSRGWAEEVDAARRLGRGAWPAIERGDATPMHPLRVVAAVRSQMRPGDVFVSDGGEFGQWAQAGMSLLDPPPARVVNGPSGAIGGGLPFAIGAKLARPEAGVFAFQGDGSVGYHLMELETAARRGIPLVLTVGNDGKWNAEVVIQRNLGGAPLDCLELGEVRYDRAAAALGAHGEHVTRPDELDGAISRALATGRPTLLNARIDAVPAPTYQPGH